MDDDLAGKIKAELAAHANLMLAAYEMFVVLEAAEKYLTASGYDKVEDCEPEYQMLMSFRAAIKKARGE